MLCNILRLCAIAGRKRLLSVLLAATIAVGLGTPRLAHAKGLGLIRDSETEELIRDYARPIFKVAGLGSQGIKIHLVSDTSFNAFVVDGQNMFIHIGALMHSKTPNQLIGVIAHETGHITGADVAGLRTQINRARSGMLILQGLAIAAIATGAATGGGGNDLAEGGTAILYGSQSLIQRSILQYRRTKESTADQAAVRFLNATRQSARGMLETFEYFADQGLTGISNVDPYVQSHPMPRQRIAQLRELAHASPYFNAKDSDELQLRHDLMRAKLIAFLNKYSPNRVSKYYPQTDQSLPAQYARAIASNFKGNLNEAVAGLDKLILAQPKNPYYQETKGQFLLEAGRSRDAVGPLKKAISLKPRSELMLIMLAQALLNLEDPKFTDQALAYLGEALRINDTSWDAYRVLAIAYNRKGMNAEADLATAKSHLYAGKIKDAKAFASRAKRKFPTGSTSWIQAEDILVYQHVTR